MPREWLKRLRSQLGMTQEELAGRIGMAQGAYSRLESGRDTPRDLIKFLFDLSSVSNVPVLELFIWEVSLRANSLGSTA